MDGFWIDAVARLARLSAIALAACGLFLVFLDMGRTQDSSGVRSKLRALWQSIATTQFAALPGRMLARVSDEIDRFVVYWFEQSERNAATSGIFSVVVLIVIPLAALVNWLGGGSPRLLIALVASAGGIVVLAVCGERRQWSMATSILAPTLFTVIFIAVPLYVFISLTDRALNMSIAHASLASLLLAPLLYLVCHSVVLAGFAVSPAPVPSRLTGRARHIATLFIATLPFAFVATFAAMLAGHLAQPELSVPSTWPALTASMVATSLSVAVTLSALDRVMPGRLASRLGIAVVAAATLAVGVAIGGLGGLDGGAPVSLIALPLLVPAVLVGLVALAIGAKAVLALVQSLPGGDGALERPFRISGVFLLVLAVGAGWASVGF